MEDITILIPTFNRRKFLPLLIRNIECQDYDHNKIKIIIDDDGAEKLIQSKQELDEIKEHLHPIEITYITDRKWRSIGQKRNELVKLAKTKVVTFLDDDDLYMPTYLSHNYQILKNNKAGCVGSNAMIFAMSDRNFDLYALQCGDNKTLIHEATLMFTKKWFNSSQKFANSSQGEGVNIFQGNTKNVILTDIRQLMICIQHADNTVDKLPFATEETKLDIKLEGDLIEIIKNILQNKMLS